MYTYIYIYIHVCMYVYIYIYIYIALGRRNGGLAFVVCLFNAASPA